MKSVFLLIHYVRMVEQFPARKVQLGISYVNRRLYVHPGG